jgi:hypothetical protein
VFADLLALEDKHQWVKLPFASNSILQWRVSSYLAKRGNSYLAVLVKARSKRKTTSSTWSKLIPLWKALEEWARTNPFVAGWLIHSKDDLLEVLEQSLSVSMHQNNN